MFLSSFSSTDIEKILKLVIEKKEHWLQNKSTYILSPQYRIIFSFYKHYLFSFTCIITLFILSSSFLYFCACRIHRVFISMQLCWRQTSSVFIFLKMLKSVQCWGIYFCWVWNSRLMIAFLKYFWSVIMLCHDFHHSCFWCLFCFVIVLPLVVSCNFWLMPHIWIENCRSS